MPSTLQKFWETHTTSRLKVGFPGRPSRMESSGRCCGRPLSSRESSGPDRRPRGRSLGELCARVCARARVLMPPPTAEHSTQLRPLFRDLGARLRPLPAVGPGGPGSLARSQPLWRASRGRILFLPGPRKRGWGVWKPGGSGRLARPRLPLPLTPDSGA